MCISQEIRLWATILSSISAPCLSKRRSFIRHIVKCRVTLLTDSDKMKRIQKIYIELCWLLLDNLAPIESFSSTW
jgi:hypothetical protein